MRGRFALLVAAAGSSSPALAKTWVPPVPSEREVVQIAQDGMAKAGASGLAIAVMDRGQVRSLQAFGVRNGKGDPLTTDTVMYGASLTKMVFATLVMQLVDEGRIDLDKPLASYLAKPLPEYGNLEQYGKLG